VPDRDLARPAGVLFDFSGTLFHIESAADAVRLALGDESAHHAAALVRWGAINGASPPADLPAELSQVWAERDLSAAAHRAAYSGSARHAGLDAEQAAALYERGISPAAWSPYPDTAEVLRRLHGDGVPIAMVSNIGWDPRPVLRRHGVADDIDVLVLSDERGVLKPDPDIFRQACADIGVEPHRAVMVGDNPQADGGAAALGIRFVLVTADPAERAPDALLRAVGFSPG
jgi:putative hydrolase of the HAD superfamily